MYYMLFSLFINKKGKLRLRSLLLKDRYFRGVATFWISDNVTTAMRYSRTLIRCLLNLHCSMFNRNDDVIACPLGT